MPISIEETINAIRQLALKQIGRTVADYRGRKGQILTQEKLAEKVGVTRTTVAHLEEGRDLPSADVLTSICEHIEIPQKNWVAATHPFYINGYVFHELTCELFGRNISLLDHAASDQTIALDRAQNLFQSKLTLKQAHTEVNSLLVFYGERPLTFEFFKRYLGNDAFKSNELFLKKLRLFQAEAMRLYGNFRRAFTRMSRVSDFRTELLPIEQRPLDEYKSRAPFKGIKEIPSTRLADLGYIAAQRITAQNRERLELSDALKEIATGIDRNGTQYPSQIPKRKLSRIRTLLRSVDSTVQLESDLFFGVDSITLREEAKRITPADSELTRISKTQSEGLHNLGVYLSEQHMDVYVATSMREDADFHSVNSFAKQLFEDESISELKLRFFNPTQSWIEDRVSKGLVEALMLRRAAVTIYMAQKGDTFGKDSEASVALGQGKSVIVYVPRLFNNEFKIDSEKIFLMNSTSLDSLLSDLGHATEEELDNREKSREAIRLSITKLTDEQFSKLVFDHWADFDLHAECKSINNANLKKSLLDVLAKIIESDNADSASRLKFDVTARAELTDKIVSVADKFESRARLFRDTHPLALQVIVRSGVLNGILVTRSVSQCAALLRGILSNTLEYEVEVDESNYKLIERTTRSTIRVVSRHRLLTFAFWSQYFDPDNFSLPNNELPVATL